MRISEDIALSSVAGLTPRGSHGSLRSFRRDLRVAVKSLWYTALRRRDHNIVRQALADRNWRRYAQLQTWY